ncbi:hypothetical protein ES708_25994 [subsurface metagenome]
MERIEGVNWWPSEDFINCPFCEGVIFLKGPKGGLSVNFKCAGCGSTFNHMSVFGVELIEKCVPAAGAQLPA